MNDIFDFLYRLYMGCRGICCGFTAFGLVCFAIFQFERLKKSRGGSRSETIFQNHYHNNGE